MKQQEIWARFNTDQKQLKLDCVDLVSKCYMMLGQKPETEQVVLMAQMLYDDLINRYSRMTMDEVAFAFEQAIRSSDEGGFVNVRTMNLWLKEYKKKAQLKRQQNRLTEYQIQQQNQKRIAHTIKKANLLK